MAQRILVCDDEPDVVDLLQFHLEQAGYTVATASDGASFIREVQRETPNLVLLDVMLPDAQGTDLLRTVRRDPNLGDIPVILVTAKAEEIDRVVGFELGADDYIVKPFSPREVVLRVQALLRRSTTETKGPDETLKIGPIILDVPKHQVSVDGEPVGLTALEFRLLLDLATRRGRVQSRESLLQRVWNYSGDLETRTVDTHVKRLREKLGDAGRWIETIRGVGYRVRDD